MAETNLKRTGLTALARRGIFRNTQQTCGSPLGHNRDPNWTQRGLKNSEPLPVKSLSAYPESNLVI